MLWKLILFIPMLLLYLLNAFSYVILLLFFPTQDSFQMVTPFDGLKGYQGSYHQHRRLRRWVSLSALSSTLVIILITVIDSFIFVNRLAHGSETCQINSNIDFNQAYINSNNCGDIVITGDSTLTLSDILNLGGDADNTLTINSGVTATLIGSLRFADTGDSLLINGTLTNESGNYTGVDLTISTITINTGGSISVNGEGCSGGSSVSIDPGYGPGGTICEAAGTGAGGSSAQSGGGGAHGGAGGAGSTGSTSGSSYDDPNLPHQLGAGGGRATDDVTATGGAGGGLIRIYTSNLAINGTITADGVAGSATGAVGGGGGGGGAIFLNVTGTLAGTGSLTARGGDGGNGSSFDGGGGGGGIIAVQYITLASGTTVHSNTNAIGGGAQDNAFPSGNGIITLLQFTAPNTPAPQVIVDPVEARNPTIVGNTYGSNGLSHTTSDWKMATDSAGDNIVWSATDSTDQTSIKVDTLHGSFSGLLAGEPGLKQHTHYFAFVRYKNAAGSSSWSSGLDGFDTPNLTPMLNATIPDISAVANQATINLNDYFSDPGDTLTYSFADDFDDTLGTATINSDNTVTFNANSADPTSDVVTFRATDGLGSFVDSNAITVTVTNGTGSNDVIETSEISYVSGAAQGAGIVTVYDDNQVKIAEWQANGKGGVRPMLVFLDDTPYVFTVKRSSGSTMRVYDINGVLLKTKTLSSRLHRRQFSLGQLNTKTATEEVVVSAKRAGTVYFKVFSFDPADHSFTLLKRANYQHLQTERFQISIKSQTVLVRNQRGMLLEWKPILE